MARTGATRLETQIVASTMATNLIVDLFISKPQKIQLMCATHSQPLSGFD